MIRVFRALLLLTIACSCQACATAHMWEGALTPDWSNPVLHGVVVDQAGTPQSAVVSYSRPRLLSSETAHAVVPLTYDVRQQKQALRLSPTIQLADGQRLLRVRTRHTCDRHGDSFDVMTIQYPLPAPDAEVVPPPAPESPFRMPSATGELDPESHEVSHELGLASRLPRSAKDRFSSAGGAVFLTPVSLLADVTVVPLLVLGMAVTGEWL